MRIYISIPITNQDEPTQRRTANAYKRLFESTGNEVINPFDLADKLRKLHKDCKKPIPTWTQYMEVDLPEVQACSMIFLCNGWEKSLGCLQELKTAIDLNLKIMLEANMYPI